MHITHTSHGYMYIQMDQQQMQSKISFLQEGQKMENSMAIGKHCTNYSTEVTALEQGAKSVYDLTDQTSDVVTMTMTMTMK